MILAVLSTPACIAIPFAGWVSVIGGWIMVVREFQSAARDEAYPTEHFEASFLTYYHLLA